MKGLYGLWKINTAVVVLQALVGWGIFALLPYAPRAPETLLEHIGETLTFVTLLTMLFGALSGYSIIDNIFLPLPVAWTSSFLSIGAGMTSFGVTLLHGVYTANGLWWDYYEGSMFTLFGSVVFGGMAISLFVESAYIAYTEDGKNGAAKASKLIYAVTALPWGIGVIGGGALLLLRKLLSSR